MTYYPALLAPLTCILTLTACGPEAPINNSPDSIATATFADSLDLDLAGSTRNEAGLYWRDLVVGEGDTVKSGQVVEVSYDGRLPDGSQFDATKPGDPFSFRAGVGQVIAGWDQGVVGMRVGGKRQLIIPATLGYGASGAGGVIPPNAVLVFTVEVHAAR
jgi:peptidylprolyl isomerase